jgi:alkanesulfonate monooxygenase
VGFLGGLIPSFPQTDDPWVIAAALARETRSFRFMLAFQPGFGNPVHAARATASLQRATGGRTLFNIITGGGGPSQLWWGDSVSHDDRYSRTSEWLDVFRGVVIARFFL